MTPTTPDSRGTKRTASGTTKTTLSGKGARLRDFLKINNLFINNKKAEKGYPQILERAEAIVHRDRNSIMKADSEKKLWDTRETYGNGERNEDTFMKHFWGKLIRDEREVEDDDASDLIKPTWKALAWEHCHLDDNWNREFRKGSIPEVDIAGDKVWAKLLNTCERVKNPKPDIAYGLSQDAFTDAENRVNASYFKEASISPGILFPGLVVEGKTAGIMEIVECQCARGGSALVNAMRQFRQVSGVSISKPGADLDTFVFSIALVPTLANLSVHWAEITEDGRTRFHMNTVDSYALLKKGQFKELRHDINNVLDWITDDRKIFLKQIIEVITQKILTDGLIPPEPMDDDAEDNADEDSISEDEEDDALGVVQGGEGAILLRANEVEEGLELGRGKRRRFPSKR